MVVRGSEVGKTEGDWLKKKYKFLVMRKIRSEDLMYNTVIMFLTLYV